MATIQLDFHRAPVSRWRWTGWVLLAVAAALVAALGRWHADIEARHMLAQSRFDALNRQTNAAAPRRATPANDPQTLASLRRANVVIDQLTVPWDTLFDAIEAADARGLGMLALTPNARDQTLRLAGEARTMEQLMAYVERVAAQPLFDQVHLVGYATAQRDGLQVVSFTLAARWRPAR